MRGCAPAIDFSCPMDPLSDIVRVIRLDSAIYFNGDFSEPWCLTSPEARLLAPMLSAGSEHIIIYHLLIEGHAFIHRDGGDRVPLSPGDLVTLPHGHAHLLLDGARSCVTPIDVAVTLP